MQIIPADLFPLPGLCFAELFFVAGVSATVPLRLPEQVLEPGGAPRHLRPRPLLAGGRQQGEQVGAGVENREDDQHNHFN